MGYIENIMRYIAHRGLLEGPNKDKENHPDQIAIAIESGFDCEIDVYFTNGKLYLGHDNPQYEINECWLRHTNLWIHCKNIEALMYFNQYKNWNYNYFWHNSDDYTLTSKGYIWTNIGKPLTDNSVMVMPEVVDISLFNAYTGNCFAICSDYIKDIKKVRDEIDRLR